MFIWKDVGIILKKRMNYKILSLKTVCHDLNVSFGIGVLDAEYFPYDDEDCERNGISMS